MAFVETVVVALQLKICNQSAAIKVRLARAQVADIPIA